MKSIWNKQVEFENRADNKENPAHVLLRKKIISHSDWCNIVKYYNKMERIYFDMGFKDGVRTTEKLLRLEFVRKIKKVLE